ncbi:MAG: hypothetical protein P9X27_01355 [Candidatus Kaelpia aquatica]|nr:hypothetical protein [Candidatus Kaelpia aquatica]
MFKYRIFKINWCMIIALLVCFSSTGFARRLKGELLNSELDLSSQILDQIIAFDDRGSLVKSDEEKNNMAIIMLGYFKQRAEVAGVGFEGYAQALRNNVEELGVLLSVLRSSSFCIITMSTKTALFRFRLGEVSIYLDGLIRQKIANDDLTITVKSVGSSGGLEALSVAMAIYDRLYSYASENISDDDIEIQSWIKSWDINVDLYDISSGMLLKAMNILGNREQVPIDIAGWEEGSETADVLEYREYLLSRYLVNNSIDGNYASIAPELIEVIDFSFHYMDLFDPLQAQRVVVTPYEIAFHANITTVGDSPSNFPMEDVQVMLENNFNSKYPGIGVWYKATVNYYP